MTFRIKCIINSVSFGFFVGKIIVNDTGDANAVRRKAYLEKLQNWDEFSYCIDVARTMDSVHTELF